MAMKIEYTVSTLPFEYPFTISGGRTKTVQQALIIKITLGEFIGYGEAPAISYYNVPIEKMIDDLEINLHSIENAEVGHPEEFYQLINQLFPNNSFLRCALDMAYWDAYGKTKNLPLFAMWGCSWNNHLPITDYTLGIDPIDKLIQKIDDHPWPVYKIKVGSENDLDNLSTLRNYCHKPFRIDANAGWGFDESIEKFDLCEKLKIELIEQPLSVNEIHKMPQLKKLSKIPLFADESCVHEKDVELCANGFHGINIKLTKCGGITPALRMIENARKLNLLVMMGSMNESTIGSAAIAQFLPLIDYVDMDGPLLLKEDLATGLTIDYGKISLSGKAGLGIELIRDIFN
jgi:L-alanine-DL-glutamate epimerase-like enolase superfamily enzyme